MTTNQTPAKVPGLHIERTNDELLVFNSRDDTSHALTDLAAAVFEACNGVRPPHDSLADWGEAPAEIDLVDQVILDLTDAHLIAPPGASTINAS